MNQLFEELEEIESELSILLSQFRYVNFYWKRRHRLLGETEAILLFIILLLQETKKSLQITETNILNSLDRM